MQSITVNQQHVVRPTHDVHLEEEASLHWSHQQEVVLALRQATTERRHHQQEVTCRLTYRRLHALCSNVNTTLSELHNHTGNQ